jgi:hypothetical protein
MTPLKGDVDDFSYFSLIYSYFIFYPESSLVYNERTLEKLVFFGKQRAYLQNGKVVKPKSNYGP